jgi:hypothetical protein
MHYTFRGTKTCMNMNVCTGLTNTSRDLASRVGTGTSNRVPNLGCADIVLEDFQHSVLIDSACAKAETHPTIKNRKRKKMVLRLKFY